ncbi:hypothetical protein RB195_005313 [Necator americanus]|uniref:Uncharacterized protein n=1 Tax=Necator americanus TaxID=51031 RepID=A0ABR1BM77_NECAM
MWRTLPSEIIGEDKVFHCSNLKRGLPTSNVTRDSRNRSKFSLDKISTRHCRTQVCSPLRFCVDFEYPLFPFFIYK